MLNWIGVVLWLIPRRIRPIWLTLAITSFGVMATTTIASASEIYSRAIAQSGLQHVIATTSLNALNGQLMVHDRPIARADYESLNSTVNNIIQKRIGTLVNQTNRRGQTHPNIPFAYSSEPNRASLNIMLGRPFFLTKFEQYSELREGNWPSKDYRIDANGIYLEAVIGEHAARSMAISVGDEVFLFPHRTDTSQRITLKVSGIAHPSDPFDPYWLGVPFYFNLQEVDEKPLIPFYVKESAFLDGIGGRFSALVGDFAWLLYLNTDNLRYESLQDTREAFAGLETDINKKIPRSLLLTLLENSRGTGLLATFQQDLLWSRVPLIMFVTLVLSIVFYFLFVILGFLGRSRNPEASILRSRGTSKTQSICLLTLTEGLIVMVITITTPFLALLISKTWLLTTIQPAGTWESSSTGLSLYTFLWSGIVGILTLLILLLSSVNLSRIHSLEFLRSRSRPPNTYLIQRYYVDILIMVIMAILWWQLEQRDSLIGRAISSSSIKINPTLLLVPTLGLVTTSFIILRILPCISRITAKWISYTPYVWIRLSFARIARDSLSLGLITVIVMMATAICVLGSAFQETLTKSHEDQYLYKYGGDVVLTHVSFSNQKYEKRKKEIIDINGIESVSPVIRDTGIVLGNTGGKRTKIFALDPVTFPSTSWFREDLSPNADTLTELLAPLKLRNPDAVKLQSKPPAGLIIPINTDQIRVWVNTENLNSGVSGLSLNLYGRLLDSSGSYHNVLVGVLESKTNSGPKNGGWIHLEFDITHLDHKPPGTLSLVSFFLSGSGFSRMPPGSLSFDDITAIDTDLNKQQVIEDFERMNLWTAYAHEKNSADTVHISNKYKRSGDLGIGFSWIEPLEKNNRGILIPPGESPIPTIGGPEFQKGQQLRFKIDNRIIPLVVVDTTDFFPTFKPSVESFLIVSMQEYLDYSRRYSGDIVERPKEFWLSLDQASNRPTVISSLDQLMPDMTQIQDRQSSVNLAVNNPLHGSSWTGLFIIGVGVISLAVLITCLIQVTVSIRTWQMELSVLSIIGVSRLQMISALVVEKVFITLIGMGTGYGVGLLVARWMLTFLDQNVRGHAVVPPAIFEMDLGLFLIGISGIVISCLVSILFATYSVIRLPIAEILRTGD